jgi:hypothetical protein
MGWTISHGTYLAPSATAIHELARHAASALSGREWRQLTPLINRRDGDPFTIPAAEAGRFAVLLRKTANHRRMPTDSAAVARQLAEAADRAARAGQPWEWS